jgi:hypothetical protein
MRRFDAGLCRPTNTVGDLAASTAAPEPNRTNPLAEGAEGWKNHAAIRRQVIFSLEIGSNCWTAVVSAEKGSVRRETPVLLLQHLSGAYHE